MLDKRKSPAGLASVCGLIVTLLTACGGGGGSTTPVALASPLTPTVPRPTSTPHATPTPKATSTPTAAPSATPGPLIKGIAAIRGVIVPGAHIVFSCGCTGQAGTTVADASGNYALSTSTSATPAAPSPVYTTVPGRNYLEVITAPSGAQAWDIAFLGSTPAHNHTLNATNTSNAYTTAAALYVFYNSISSVKQNAFDTWNFTTIASWVSAMESAPLASETTLLNDIVTQQIGFASLYPGNGAAWVPPGVVPNATMKRDLEAVKAAAGSTSRLPQQCLPAGEPCAVPTP